MTRSLAAGPAGVVSPTPDQHIVLGDCLDIFRNVRGLDAIVSDLPANIAFMGRSWDRARALKSYTPPVAPRSKAHLRSLQERQAFVVYWAERLGVAYDSCADDAVALIWTIPRTSDQTAEAMRLAGWDIRDVIPHHFGQGWPKHKAALKPASEQWILAVKGSPALDIDACRVRRNWDERGEAWLRSGHSAKPGAQKITGAPAGNGIHPNDLGSWPTNALFSHAEGCRRAGMRKVKASAPQGNGAAGLPTKNNVYHSKRVALSADFSGGNGTETLDAYACLVGCDCGAAWLAMAGGPAPRCECGRPGWWACPVAEMDAQSGTLKTGAVAEGQRRAGLGYGSNAVGDIMPAREASEGGASRYFPRFGYYGKAPSGERHAGCEDLYWRGEPSDPFGFVRISREEWEALDVENDHDTCVLANERRRRTGKAQGNVHPTVKRLALMRWLHKLTGAKRIGDLCGGSGSGAVAAFLDGIEWIGAEVCPQAIEIAEARLRFWRGCSPAAIARFLAEDEVPTAPAALPIQPSLFSGGAL